MNKEEEKEEQEEKNAFEDMSGAIQSVLEDTRKTEGSIFAGTSNAALLLAVVVFVTVMTWQYPVVGKVFLSISLVLAGYIVHKFAEMQANITRRLTTIAAMFALYSTSFSVLVAAGIKRAAPLFFDEEEEEKNSDETQL